MTTYGAYKALEQGKHVDYSDFDPTVHRTTDRISYNNALKRYPPAPEFTRVVQTVQTEKPHRVTNGPVPMTKRPVVGVVARENTDTHVDKSRIVGEMPITDDHVSTNALSHLVARTPQELVNADPMVAGRPLRVTETVRDANGNKSVMSRSSKSVMYSHLGYAATSQTKPMYCLKRTNMQDSHLPPMVERGFGPDRGLGRRVPTRYKLGFMKPITPHIQARVK